MAITIPPDADSAAFEKFGLYSLIVISEMFDDVTMITHKVVNGTGVKRTVKPTQLLALYQQLLLARYNLQLRDNDSNDLFVTMLAISPRWATTIKQDYEVVKR